MAEKSCWRQHRDLDYRNVDRGIILCHACGDGYILRRQGWNMLSAEDELVVYVEGHGNVALRTGELNG